MMFVLSETHPFLDGNGRLARVMMNAELVKGRQAKIIIPTVFRDDYIGTLKKLTKHGDSLPYIRMLMRTHEFSATIYDDDINKMETFLASCNAFKDPTEGHLKILPR